MIGPTGLSPMAIVEGTSAGSDILYVTHDSSLYRIDTTTGASALIGTWPSGLFGSMVVEGSHDAQLGVRPVVFAEATNPSAVWILNHRMVSDFSGGHDRCRH